MTNNPLLTISTTISRIQNFLPPTMELSTTKYETIYPIRSFTISIIKSVCVYIYNE